jgi:hypothetical protein
MYENAIAPEDTAIPEMSINCTMEEGNKARTKAKIVRLRCRCDVELPGQTY